MHRFWKVLALAVSIACASVAVFGAPDPLAKVKFRHVERPVLGEYIVVFKDTVAEQDRSALADRLSIAYGGVTKRKFRRALAGFAVKMSASSAASLSTEPEVEFVEENGTARAVDVEYSPPWGLDRLDQHDLPLSNSYDNNGYTGAGVTVYVLDSGIRLTHQEFDGRAYVGADFIGDGLNGTDGFGHGTHVSGIIGGRTYGVAKQVRLCSVRVLNTAGSGTWDQVIAGIDWITTNHSGPSVANMSLEGPPSTSVDRAVQNSIASGVTYVVAAGNDNVDASTKSPAHVAQAITVGATDATDTRAYFSNYGSSVDVFAPGVGILSAWNTSDAAAYYADGTSMAAPHVAGLAALHLQRSPGDSPATVQAAIVKNATTDKVLNAGTGSPNRLAYVESAPTVNHSPTVSVSVEGHNSGDVIAIGSTITVHFSAADVDGNLSGVRGSRWYPATSYYDYGDGSFAVPQSGTNGDLVKTFTLTSPGDWYFWCDAIDGQGGAACSPVLYDAYKITVVSAVNHSPTVSVSVEGHNSGDVISIGSTITVHFSAADVDGNLSGVRGSRWYPATSYYDYGDGSFAVPQSGTSGDLMKTFTLTSLGDWYFWCDAIDGQGGAACTPVLYDAYKITVVSAVNHSPTVSVSVEGHNSGDVISIGSTITVHFSAADVDGNLSGVRGSRWYPATSYYDYGDGSFAVPQSGINGDVVKTFTLTSPGDWYFWCDAIDGQGGAACTPVLTDGYKIVVSDSSN